MNDNDWIESESDQQRANFLKQFENQTPEMAEQLPSSESSDRFYNMLEREIERQPSSKKTFSQLFQEAFGWNNLRAIAAGIALFVLGMMLGANNERHQQTEQELVELKNQVDDINVLLSVSLMEDFSTSERLQNIAQLQNQISSPGVKNSLLALLNNDPSPAVRLATIETLVPQSEKQNEQRALINAVANQQNSLVQLTLIRALLTSDWERYSAPIQKIRRQGLLHSEVEDYLDVLFNNQTI